MRSSSMSACVLGFSIFLGFFQVARRAAQIDLLPAWTKFGREELGSVAAYFFVATMGQ